MKEPLSDKEREREEMRIIGRLKEALGEAFIKHEFRRYLRKRTAFVTIRKEGIRQAAEILLEEGARLMTASGVDLGAKRPELEVIYHLVIDDKGIILNIRASVPKEKPVMDSITPLIPGASFIEREIHDLFGVRFEGHPDPRRLILPDDWPEGVCPLRKSYKLERR